jgi:hypothetical protein
MSPSRFREQLLFLILLSIVPATPLKAAGSFRFRQQLRVAGGSGRGRPFGAVSTDASATRRFKRSPDPTAVIEQYKEYAPIR